LVDCTTVHGADNRDVTAKINLPLIADTLDRSRNFSRHSP
jgi:hypothetical protein